MPEAQARSGQPQSYPVAAKLQLCSEPSLVPSVDVAEVQHEFAQALQLRGFVPGFRTARMIEAQRLICGK